MTNREELVSVRTKNGLPMSFSHGRCSLILAAGETADKWLDGSPITLGEFENVLAPHAEVEIAPPAAAAQKKDASLSTEE